MRFELQKSNHFFVKLTSEEVFCLFFEECFKMNLACLEANRNPKIVSKNISTVAIHASM